MKKLLTISLGGTTTINTSILRCLMLEESNKEEARRLVAEEKSIKSLPRKKITRQTGEKRDA